MIDVNEIRPDLGESNLHWKMSAIVRDYVKHYQTDFALDSYIFASATVGFGGGPGEWFVWIVREHGTHAHRITDVDGYKAGFEVFGKEVMRTGGFFLVNVRRYFRGGVPTGRLYQLTPWYEEEGTQPGRRRFAA